METDRGTQTPAAQSQPDAESQPGPPPTMERECLHASDAPQKNKKNCVCDRPLDDGHSHDELIGRHFIEAGTKKVYYGFPVDEKNIP